VNVSLNVDFEITNTEGEKITKNTPTAPSLPSGFKIAHININGLSCSKVEDVKYWIELEKFQVFCVTESKLNPNYDSGLFKVNGFNLVRLDREHKAGGGIVMYLNDEMAYSILDLELKFKGDVEILSIQCRKPYMKSMIFTTIYKPPNCDVSKFLLCFNELIRELEKYQSEYYILGDFNIDLNASSPQSKQGIAAYF